MGGGGRRKVTEHTWALPGSKQLNCSEENFFEL